MKKNRFEAPDINLIESLTAQLMNANRELEETNRRLLKSERARTEMLANISHDLRAPLTAIRGALDRLLDGGSLCEKDRLSMISIMDRRVAALEHLVNELYYSVSIEQPGFRINLSPILIAPFLDEWYIERQSGDDCARRDMRLEIPADFDVKVLLDPDRMVRVLDNLLNNALRFTSPGGQISLGCRSGGRGFIEIHLSDSGCGIDREDMPHIFERTYTASPARAPAENFGSGLGLHIAKSIVEMHNGSIRCESKPGYGSVFIIRLPACPGD